MRSNTKLEMKVLRTATDGDARMRGYILPLLKELHFSSAQTQGLFRRIIHLQTTGNTIPVWTDLMHDPGVRPDTRKVMASMSVKPHSTKQRVDSTLAILERLRKVRMLYELGSNLEKGLDDEEVDPDAILAQIQKDITLVGSHAVQTRITKIGKGSNLDAVLDNIFNNNGLRRIPTGIDAFDQRNVGFVNDGVVILAASTGGGKSALLDQILNHMANLGASVATLPLEMDAEENITRGIARETGVSMTDLIDPQKRMTKRERILARKKFKRYSRRMAKRGGSVTVIEPGFSATIENVLAFVDPLDFNVIGIDYVALLDGVNGDDQWRALSNAVAYAKRFASRPHKKTLIIFAAQITDEDKLKQSKSMADHCTNVWRWRVDDQIREDGIVVVHQDKCRGGAVFDIPIGLDFEHMHFSNLSAKRLEEWQLAQRDKEKPKQGAGGARWKQGGGKGMSKRGSKPKLEEDEDDESANEVIKLPPRKQKARAREY